MVGRTIFVSVVADLGSGVQRGFKYLLAVIIGLRPSGDLQRADTPTRGEPCGRRHLRGDDGVQVDEFTNGQLLDS